jgi:hypothetical protein
LWRAILVVCAGHLQFLDVSLPQLSCWLTWVSRASRTRRFYGSTVPTAASRQSRIWVNFINVVPVVRYVAPVVFTSLTRICRHAGLQTVAPKSLFQWVLNISNTGNSVKILPHDVMLLQGLMRRNTHISASRLIAVRRRRSPYTCTDEKFKPNCGTIVGVIFNPE